MSPMPAGPSSSTPPSSNTPNASGRKSTARRIAGFAAKLGVTGLLIAYIASKADLAALAERLAQLSIVEVLEILSLLIVQILVVAERWRRVSVTLGVPLTFADSLRIFWIGSFFTQGMPSSIGGDVIRVWLVRRLGSGWGQSISSVFADRIMALITVIAISAASLPWFVSLVPDRAPAVTLGLMGLGCLVGIVVLIIAAHPVERLVSPWRILRQLMRFALDIRTILVRVRVFSAVLLLSVLVMILTIVVLMVTGRALGVELGFWHCIVLVPPILLILAVPISFAGWGLREGVMIYLFGFIGLSANDSLAISVTYGLAMLLVAIPGGIIWLASGLRPPAQIELETETEGDTSSPKTKDPV